MFSINREMAYAAIDFRMRRAETDDERSLLLLQRMCDHDDINIMFDTLGANTVLECKKCGFTLKTSTQTEPDK